MCSLTVIFLIDQLNKTGGAERSFFLLAKGLRDRGHTIIICCLKGGKLSKKMQEDGFRVENLNIKKIYNLNGLKTILKVIGITRKENVSAIVTYHEGSDYMGILVGLLTRIPVVSSRRDMGFKLKSRHIWVYRIINHLFDYIVTVSAAVKEVIINTQWANSSYVAVIENGIDMSLWDKGQENCPDYLNLLAFDKDCLKICCVANFRPIKGHKYLIDAFHLIIQRFHNVRLFLVGGDDIPGTNYDDVQEQVRNLGLEKFVIFMGPVPHSNMRDLLTSMDISILPSLSEGMSNTILESMAAGKPVVATAVGGNPELVEDGKTGYLIPPGDPKMMAEALISLLTNPELRHQMGQQGRYRVASLFNLTRVVERYEDLLKFVYVKKRSPCTKCKTLRNDLKIR